MADSRFSLGSFVLCVGFVVAAAGACGGRLQNRLEENDAGEGGEGGDELPRPAGSSGTTAGSGGTTAGSGGTGGVSNCDWQTALTKSCGISACHGRITAYAGLLLTIDDGLVARLKDVPATFGDIDCDPGASYVPCEPPPPDCAPYAGAKLIDSENPEASYFLTTMRPRSGCGNRMPIDPGDSPAVGWSNERLDCLEDWVRAVAALPSGQ